MQIGILGTGHIGGNLADLVSRAGHQVRVSSSRSPEASSATLKKMGTGIMVMSAEQAIQGSDLVILAIPWRKRQTLPNALQFAGKIVVDAMNAYTPTFQVEDFGDSTSSEEIAKQLTGVRLIKAFNTMDFETQRTGGRSDLPLDQRLTLFIAGDDAEAKQIVSELILQIGFAPFDTGSLHEGGRKQQPDSAIYNRPLTLSDARSIFEQLV